VVYPYLHDGIVATIVNPFGLVLTFRPVSITNSDTSLIHWCWNVPYSCTYSTELSFVLLDFFLNYEIFTASCPPQVFGCTI
jgi:hypothetical protein